MQTNTHESVLVLGAGNFGTCLAQHLATVGHQVTLWSRSSEVCCSINKQQINPKYLTSVILSDTITATDELTPELVKTSTMILLAIPTQSLRSVLSGVREYINESQLLVSAVKGIEVDTLKLPDMIVSDLLGEKTARELVALSGPSFAIEVATKMPTAVTMACRDEERAQRAQAVFHAPFFRVYTSTDVISLEVAGALKNIIAIASGACDGLGFQANSRAAVITRGLAEMTRVGVAMGGNPLTFNGLSGVGDLFLTCTSQKSRNYTVGYRLGRGESLEQIVKTLGSVAEGVHTAKSAHYLSEKLGVQLPIAEEVYKVLYKDKPIKRAVNDLLHREAKSEHDH